MSTTKARPSVEQVDSAGHQANEIGSADSVTCGAGTQSVAPSSVLRCIVPKMSNVLNKSNGIATKPRAKARRINLYRNGDKFFKAMPLSVSEDQIRSFGALLSYIGQTPVADPNVLTKGVRYIFTVNGDRIEDLASIEDGESYVCSSDIKFRKINYAGIRGNMWNARTKLSDSELKLGADSSQLRLRSDDTFIRAQMVFVIKAGARPRTKTRLLLNKKNCGSFDNVLTTFAKALNMETGVIKQLRTVTGRLITCLKDLFMGENVLIAFGLDKFSSDELVLDSEETKFVSTLTTNRPHVGRSRTPARPASDLKQTTVSSPDLESHQTQNTVDCSRSAAADDREIIGDSSVEPRANSASPAVGSPACYVPAADEPEIVSTVRPFSATSRPDEGPIVVKLPRATSDVSEDVSMERDSLLAPDSCRVDSTSFISPRGADVDVEWPRILVDKYTVQQIVAESKYMTVWRCCIKSCCETLELSEPMAVKIVYKKRFNDGLRESLINSEVSILRRLKHQNLLGLVDDVETTDRIYLVLPLLTKSQDLYGTLLNWSKSVYCEKDAVNLLAQLCSALKFLHSINVVHRHVKPDNCLVYESSPNQTRVLKLCDFGLAADVGPSPLYDLCGAAAFLAPEILSQTGYDTKVDVWAAGLVGCILLTGTTPVACANVEKILLRQRVTVAYIAEADITVFVLTNLSSGSTDLADVFTAILNFKSSPSPLIGPAWHDVGNQAKDLIGFMLEDKPDARATAAILLEHPWLAEDVGKERDLLPTITTNLKNSVVTSNLSAVDSYLGLVTTSALEKAQYYYKLHWVESETSASTAAAAAGNLSCCGVKPNSPRSSDVGDKKCSARPASPSAAGRSSPSEKSQKKEVCDFDDEAKTTTISDVLDRGEGVSTVASNADVASASSSFEYASLCDGSIDVLPCGAEFVIDLE